MYRRISARRDPWDIIVIGGGATGAGIAVDAASRGYELLLLEQNDFGKGTSSRSTKLVHGGVRYLEQGNLSLVMEALKERGLLLQNAPHLVRNLAFVVPAYDWWESPFYGVGLKLYNLLAGKYGFGDSRILSREETLEKLPTINPEGLRGGVVYYDGQFDDARLLIDLLQTAAGLGATVLNYAQVTALDGHTVRVRDHAAGREFEATGKVLINAAGAFTDNVRRLAEPQAEAIIAPSQGVHLVFIPAQRVGLLRWRIAGPVLIVVGRRPWRWLVRFGCVSVPVRREAVASGPRQRKTCRGEVSRVLRRSISERGPSIQLVSELR